ncbi:chemotaxis protein CheB [Luteitalea sp.]|jgi:two-component system CheB/CheR fusion protein|uniref:chemotaxis protein CheB n=1 Tax=Luteitalea sp. TaxID=2004800 RepID=UPI0037C9C7BA
MEDPKDTGGSPVERLPEDHQLQAVVGIGASAGGLDALTQLLRHLPRDDGIVVIVVQHLQADFKSTLVDLLADITSYPVQLATDGWRLRGGAVVVIPPNGQLTVAGGVLHVAPRPTPIGPQLPIDVLFQSLAEDQGTRAIGVVLSGSGVDGVRGLQAIREAGGVCIAQDPASAEYPGMPAAAVASGGVDLVLAPEAIGPEIGRLARRASARPVHDAPEVDDDADALRSIFDLLHDVSGVDFSIYREKTVRRRIDRRVMIRELDGLAAYARLLADDSSERVALQRDLFIGVTHFFRDPEAFAALATHVFPAIIRDRAPDDVVRIWVPGCATGEEAYSILMALIEYLDAHGSTTPVQVFASDINDQAIDVARAGRYPDTIADHVSPERLRRFFTRLESGYQVSRQLRERCLFSRHNLLDDPPFSRLDLISCRNVLIYLASVQRMIVPLFHYALRDPGFLLLGRAETPQHPELFEPADAHVHLYARRPGARRVQAAMPPRRVLVPVGPTSPAATSQAERPDAVSARADQILLARFSPTSVLVNEGLQVLELRGRPAPFLALTDGGATLHLLRIMVDAGLFVAVESLVREAAASGTAAMRRDVPFRRPEGDLGLAHVDVLPVGDGADRAFLVILLPGGGAGALVGPEPNPTVVAHLTAELEATRRRLLEQLHAEEHARDANLQVAEEAVSSNEALQSLAEELETAKEELQSTNEELITVNRDLEARNTALTLARDLSRSIVETVRMPLLVVDGDQAVRHVNACFERTFGVSRDDIEGRKLGDTCGGAWNIDRLQDGIAGVTRDERPFDELELRIVVGDRPPHVVLVSGRRLARTEMVLLTIEDVTERRAIELALSQSEERRRQAERMETVGRLAGGVAHDFNNLLTVIIGYCSLLERALAARPELYGQVTQIRESADRAAALTDQLLAFSQRKVLRPRVVDLNSVVDDLCQACDRMLPDRVRVVRQSADDLRPVWADPREITRALTNLVLNARDAMPAGGTLTISTGNLHLGRAHASDLGLPPGHYAEVLIGDTGLGMDTVTSDHVFEPFYTTKDVSKGAGLGLPTVLGIVQQSGGTVSIDSRVGEGTTFAVILPVARAGAADAAPLAHDEDASSVVLLVEHDRGVCELARTVLFTAGHRVLVAGTCAEALAIVRRHAPPVMLMVSDLRLPDGDGPALYADALALQPELRALFVAGESDGEVATPLAADGRAFLRKPYTLASLSRAVRDVLASA